MRPLAVFPSLLRIGGLLILLCAGCGRVFFDPLGRGDSGPAVDAGFDATAVSDASDAMTTDSAVFANCPSLDADTLALFTFDVDEGNTTVLDTSGNHDGSLNPGVAQAITGPPGCGSALIFQAGQAAEIADAPAWQLAEGSIDFWVRRADRALGTLTGLLSRDEFGTADPGHFTIFMGSDGRLVLRLQNTGAEGLCSETALPIEEWAHLGVNFGPGGLELWVNGVRETGTGTVAGNTCGTGTVGGISGNTLVWYVGASGARSTGPTDFFREGAMDHLRISRAQRDFSVYSR